MTMMYAQPAFAGAGVTELSCDEIDLVVGGTPKVAAAVWVWTKRAAIAGAAVAAAAAIERGVNEGIDYLIGE